MNWYLCTFLYAKKPDKMKGGMTDIILYNKRNTSSFSNHVVTYHKSTFSHFYSYMNGRPNIVAGGNASSLEGSMETPISRRKMPNYESYFTSTIAIF